jgi:hypothetical protein
MKRWIRGLLALSAVGLALVAALFRPGGSETPKSSADVGTGQVHIEIDMIKTGGTDWCNPVDTVATRALGSDYQVAFCLTDGSISPSDAPAVFDIEFLYDDTLNSCTDANPGGAALDDNPDANTGTTIWPSWGPDLGTNWDCNVGNLPPVCDNDTATGPGHGRAFISCQSASTPTLPVGPGVSSPIAVVTLHAATAGVDNLDFGVVAIYRSDVSNVLKCPNDITCKGATLNVLAEGTPTPSPTPTPTATPTPHGAVGGIAEPPDIESAAAASGPGASVAGAAAVAMSAALLVAVGGWYARRRWLR